MRHQHKAILMFKVVNGFCPSNLSDMFTFHKSLNDYSLRSSNTDLVLPKTYTNYYFFVLNFVFSGVKVWNVLPCSLKQETLIVFRPKLSCLLN